MWLHRNEVANGVEGLPKISIPTQTQARKDKKISWIKIGRKERRGG
jgi:hypothetical protein